MEGRSQAIRPYLTKLKSSPLDRTMARLARKQLADMRALEWEASRENIIDPRQATTQEMLEDEHSNGQFAGSGATPSMGLSQVRGGCGEEGGARQMGQKLRAYLERLHGKGYADEFAGGCGCGVSGGAAADDCDFTKKECDDDGGIFNEDTKECYDTEHEPMEKEDCGKPPHLPYEPGKPDEPSAKPAKLRVPLYSATKQYSKGDIVRVHTIGSQQDALWQATADTKGVKPTVGEPLWTKVSDTAEGAGRMVGGAGIVGGSNNVAPESGNVSKSGTYEGLGRRVVGGGESDSDEEMEGGHCPSEAHLRAEVTGLGRRTKAKRAPAGASDGRRSRAAIVKKVMAEKGMKMIEASKYVKAHKLY